MDGGFGAFGKMPSLGDFFRIEPPAGFVQVWDEWLQRSILSARDTLGSKWDEYYLSAPIWRFTLSAGLAGKHKVLGVLMPSVDRVGRQFPLTLVVQMPGAGTAVTDHFSAEKIFVEIELLALEVLNNDMTRDELADRLAELKFPDLTNKVQFNSTAKGLTLAVADVHELPTNLASKLLKQSYLSHAVFSTETEHGSRMMICEQLPDTQYAHGLFDLSAPIWSEAT